MTDHTTRKARAVFLAFVMTTSVIAGSVTLAGTVGAASNASFSAFSPTTVDEQSTVTHDLTFEVDASDGDTAADTFNLSLPTDAELSGVTVESITANGSDIAPPTSETFVDTDGDGEDEAVELGIADGNATGTTDILVQLDATVEWPRVSFDDSLTVTGEFDESGATAATATQQVTVEATVGSISGRSVSNTPVDEQTTRTHRVNFTVGNVDTAATSGGTDTFNVTLPDAYEGDISINGATVEDGGGTSITITSGPSVVDGPDGDGTVDTVQLSTNNSDGGTTDHQVSVSVNLTHPSVSSDQSQTVELQATENTGAARTSASTSFTVTAIDGNRDGKTVFAGATVFQGEEVTFGGNLKETLVGIQDSQNSGVVLNEDIRQDQPQGRYTNDGTIQAPGVTVNQPRITNFEIILN
ncbi:MAG: surface glycoprotein, partial [Salinirussus sp.]